MKDLSIFAGVAPAEFELITSAAQSKHFSEGEIMFKQSGRGREVALLLSGSVELTVLIWISGRELTRETIAPGALVSNYDGTAQAVEACWILVWDRAEFAKLLLRIPTFRTNVFKELGEMGRKLHEQCRKRTRDDEIALFGGPWRLPDASISSISSSSKTVFFWSLVGTTALLIWEIVKVVYK